MVRGVAPTDVSQGYPDNPHGLPAKEADPGLEGGNLGCFPISNHWLLLRACCPWGTVMFLLIAIDRHDAREGY